MPTTLATEREHLAWHVAGHAYMAMAFEIPVHKLSLDGFADSDLENRGDAQCLDEWTMVRLPECFRPVGSFAHTKLQEKLMLTAISGPIFELLHRDQPLTLQGVQEFTVDWHQAWNSVSFMWDNETDRLSWLSRMIHSGRAMMFNDPTLDFVWRVAPKLNEVGTMTGEEVQTAWDQMKQAAEKEFDRREKPRRRRRRSFSEEAEAIPWPPLPS